MVEVEGRYEPNDVWLWILAYPLNPGIGVMSIDVTESRKLQIELKNAVEDRDRFLSIASHELNTPLTSLKLHTQMMQRLGKQGLAEEKLDKFFRQTELQISRLSRLVDDMLDVSRIREGKLSLHLELADLRPVLTEIVERLNLYYLQSVMVVPDVKFDGQDFVCKIDLHRFEQIVNNLLTNAFKYGEGRPVHVGLADLGDKISLTVQDSGPGIPDKDQEQIFKQYNRGSAPHGDGLGLGLFITKQIVGTLGGTIALQSAPGKGASFRVELPKVRT
jgi:signal transduction histidine kinase